MTHSYTGENTYPATIPLMDDSDAPTAAAFSAPLESLGDRTAYLKNVADGSLSSAKCYYDWEAKALTDHPTDALIVIRNYGVYRFALAITNTNEPLCFALDDMSGYWVHQGMWAIIEDEATLSDKPVGMAPLYERDSRNVLSYNQVPNYTEIYTVRAMNLTDPITAYVPYTGATGDGAVVTDGTSWLQISNLDLYEGAQVHCAAHLNIGGLTGPCDVEVSFTLDQGLLDPSCIQRQYATPYVGPMHYETHVREPIVSFLTGQEGVSYPQNYSSMPFYCYYTLPWGITGASVEVLARSMTPGYTAVVWGTMQVTILHTRGKP